MFYGYSCAVSTANKVTIRHLKEAIILTLVRDFEWMLCKYMYIVIYFSKLTTKEGRVHYRSPLQLTHSPSEGLANLQGQKGV